MQTHKSFILFSICLTFSLPFFVFGGEDQPRVFNIDDENEADYENEKDLPAKPSEVKSKSLDPFTVKLFKVKWCRPDILRFCPKSSYDDNYAILQCLQKDKQTVKSVAKECNTFLLAYKRAITTSDKFRIATEKMCGPALIEQSGCKSVGMPSLLLVIMINRYLCFSHSLN